MTQSLSEHIARLGLTLPAPPKPVAAYVPAAVDGNLVQTAGQIPIADGALLAGGIVPDRVSTEQARDCARLCALNAIAAAGAAAGGVDNLLRPLKVTCYVASGPGYTDHPAVADGASLLLAEIFGDNGAHARAAVGVASLPLGAPVEIDILFRIRNA